MDRVPFFTDVENSGWRPRAGGSPAGELRVGALMKLIGSGVRARGGVPVSVQFFAPRWHTHVSGLAIKMRLQRWRYTQIAVRRPYPANR